MPAKPRSAVISASGSYGYDEVVRKLTDKGIPVYTTDTVGAIRAIQPYKNSPLELVPARPGSSRRGEAGHPGISLDSVLRRPIIRGVETSGSL